MSIITYPLDLTSDLYNNSYIKLIFFDYKTGTNSKAETKEGASLSSYGQQEANRSNSNINKTTILLSSINNGGGITNTVASAAALDFKATRIPSRTGIINLPMVQQIGNSNSYSWDSVDMKIIAFASNTTNAAAAAAQQESQGKTQNIMDNVSQFLKVWTDKDSNANTISNITKRTVGDFTEQTFSKVNKREVDFKWTFLVRSKQESEAMAKLVEFLDSRSLPSVVDGELGKMFYNFPDSVSVIFVNNGKENKKLPQFQDMVVTGLTIDYGDGTYLSQFEDGSPMQVTISIKLSEKLARVRNDLKRTFNHN